ncbi:MAG: baseplate assembly protein [Deferribacterales bacterium]
MIYGTDIKITPDMEISTSANGEIMLVDETDTVEQDIFLRLSTYYGSLFYDSEYGSYLYDFIKEEDSEDTRFALLDETERRTEADPRVVLGSVEASVLSWDLETIKISVSFRLIDTDNIFNLILALDKKSDSMVLL